MILRSGSCCTRDNTLSQMGKGGGLSESPVPHINVRLLLFTLDNIPQFQLIYSTQIENKNFDCTVACHKTQSYQER